MAVDRADFPAAVDLLQKYHLPTQPRFEVAQAFPADRFVGSPKAEQVRLLSAVEQRLEQNLTAINNAFSVRVQVSYPLETSGQNGKDEPAMHVAVLLTYRNAVNRDLFVSEVKRFVKNSFTNIDYDDISVILSEMPSEVGMMAIQPKAVSQNTWLYSFLGVSAVIAAVGGLFIFFRRQGPTLRQIIDLPLKHTGKSQVGTQKRTKKLARWCRE
ncbi:hypothetical protein AU476_09595 [Cupriavidus sp. UYMSc13B]|nr:hypothetical protein AU476_09595 [Cupriavidus sp. UYMSc13B]